MTKRVAVLGAGISGLASAYYLQRKGVTPVVFEASAEVGGLGSAFRHNGMAIERFPHVMQESDRHVMRLLRDLHLQDSVQWTAPSTGLHMNGKLHSINGKLDLLRFSPLALKDRLRAAVATLALSRLEEGEELDSVSAEHFLRDNFGSQTFDAICKPLLQARFGELYTQVSAYWLLSQLRRERMGSERKGYPEGGYRSIANALEGAIQFRGGEVRRNHLVSSVQDNGYGVRIIANGRAEEFDAVISTLPLPVLRQVTEGPLRMEIPLEDLPYQGSVNVVLVSKEPLQPHYRSAVIHPRFAFQNIVETTRVIPTKWTRGKHLIYLTNQCQAESEAYQQPDDLLRRQALNGIQGLFPGFNLNAIEGSYVFRAPQVEPVWRIGYLKQKPATHIPYSNMFLCTSAHAAPQANSWNACIGLARQIAREAAGHVKSRRYAAQDAIAV